MRSRQRAISTAPSPLGGGERDGRAVGRQVRALGVVAHHAAGAEAAAGVRIEAVIIVVHSRGRPELSRE